MKIPKQIHQVHTKGLNFLTDIDKKAIELLKKNNPDWSYFFYDYNQMIAFIKEHYSERYLDAFLKINPIYGAAQADYFRYLLMYKMGGAYFDVKSFSTCSLTNIISENDELIVFEWQGGNPAYESFGQHKKIIRGREYQQWNIICSPNNKYLKNVVEKVTQNIENYNVLKFRYGWYGVLHTTGPVPYTNAIDEVKDKSSLRLLGSSCKNGLVFKDLSSHVNNKNHYSLQKEQIVFTKKNVLSNIFFLKIWKIIFKLKKMIRNCIK